MEQFSVGYAPQVSDQFLRDFAARPENLLLIATKGGGKGVAFLFFFHVRMIEGSQTFSEGIQSRLNTIGHVKLIKYIANMCSDCGISDDQSLGNFLIAQPLGYQL